MHITFQCADGVGVEGILLAVSDARMRVIIPGQRDTVELQKSNGSWFTEEGRAIAIEALLPAFEFNFSWATERANAAGRPFLVD